MTITAEELRKVYLDRFNAEAATFRGYADVCHAYGLLAVARYVAEKQRAVEPTEEMKVAGDETGCFNTIVPVLGQGWADTVYRAMQSVAPLVVE